MKKPDGGLYDNSKGRQAPVHDRSIIVSVVVYDADKI